jgi:4-alpha-glucanotransferase
MSFDLSQRASGVVLHVSSLPGEAGSGDLGAGAHHFVDWLADAGQRIWQVLPLTPAGPGESPYQSPSAFAGNALFVALEPLVQAGWLEAQWLGQAPPGAAGRVDWPRVIPWRRAALAAAAAGFASAASSGATVAQREAFEAWRAAQAAWLPEWTLYAALKARAGLRAWWDWPADVRDRAPDALAPARRALAAEIDAEAFVQWQFDVQLAALHDHARSRGVALMGDMPIFVAHDSAEVWARRELFRVAPDGVSLEAVAGVPPDGYSPDGQRWGNPLYAWERHAEEGYAWWIARLERLLGQADVFRIDHFRGFAGFWEIPASCPTARDGRWVAAPGQALFDAVQARLGALPIVAEDLGLITPDVVALRERYGWPGMRIVYEGLMHGPAHPFVPQHHERNGLVYSSTHDSDTVGGWWAGADEAERAYAARWLGIALHSPPAAAAAAVLRATLQSVANLALVPAQDLLGLGRDHRMNRPGTAEGNWAWRAAPGAFAPGRAAALRQLVADAGRVG